MARKRKTQSEREELELKSRLHLKLDRISGMRIRVQRVRAVIGESYNHVRRGECILTYMMQDPQMLSLEILSDILSQKWKSAGHLWLRIQSEAKRYKSTRRKVTHPWERSGQD